MRYTVPFHGHDVTVDVLDDEICAVDGDSTTYTCGLFAQALSEEDWTELFYLAYTEADRDETDRLMEAREFNPDDDDERRADR